MTNILPFKKKSIPLSECKLTISVEFIDCGCYIVCTGLDGEEVFKEFWNWDKVYGELQ